MTLLLLSLLGLLLSWEEGQALVPPNELQQMSVAGSKYIDTEIENAINGVKQMKSLMDKTSKDHQEILTTLEKTKQKKEQAMQLAKETEKKLTEKPDVCNETMLALWEECKPCLKQTCMRFYSRTCRSGSGLVGRQLEEFLNRSSPISIWVNGERINSLLEEDQQQGRWLEDLEERYSLVEDSVDDLFQESTRAYGHMAPFFRSPFAGGSRRAMHAPFRFRFPYSNARVVRDTHPFFSPPRHHGFHSLFEPLFEMTQRMFERAQKAMEQNGQWFEGSQDPLLGGFTTETRNSSDDRMVCREIRRNSAGCLKMKDKCEKCQEILSVDCSQTDPAQAQLREQFEDALRLAERFTRKYDELLRTFQEEMLNTSSLLDQLNQQFGWVSRLANLTQKGDGMLQVTTVLSKTPNHKDSSRPSDTQVTVQLFDSDPLSLTVPGEIPWDDPKFMEVVADEALKRYKQNTIE
ncbi:clusterin [Gopherus evgoodei]|uniref:Clusterin n=1 Tax=Gopherus evgoodei TaxID=1825980 RepID=A0A8C4W8P0_9SAUR|nr:clusterin [Gopherus evgoodei]